MKARAVRSGKGGRRARCATPDTIRKNEKNMSYYWEGVRARRVYDCNFAKVWSVRYRYSRYRYGRRTELTNVPGTGVDVVPNLPKCPVPVLEVYRNYQSVRHSTKVCTGTGTGIDTVPNFPNFPVPVLMSYRTSRSLRYRY